MAKHSSYIESQDDSRILSPIAGHSNKFKRSYDSTRQKAQQLQGMIVFGIAISPNGTVLDSVVIKTSIQHYGLIEKIQKRLQSIRFAPYLDGQGRVSDFRFNFHPE